MTAPVDPAPAGLRFCANLGFLFTEVPFVERFARAAACGFRGVEYMSPYEADPAELRRLLQENALEQVLFNLPAGDWDAGERGIGCHPDRIDAFERGLRSAIAIAGALDCTRLNCLSGLAPPGIADAVLADTFVANLRRAARDCAGAGIRLLIEPINSRIDMPGFWLDTVSRAMEIIDAVGDDNLWLQFDIYHAAVMSGEVLPLLDACLPRIAHIQIADHPGRHQPGTGTIAYDRLFGRLAESGYAGWIGCEYRPLGRSEDSLGWRDAWK